MNILVTGGAGFLGSHLCKVLLDNSNRVYCLDNFYSSHKSNIKMLLDKPNFTFIEQDVCKLSLDVKVDQIYNLACPASPIYYQADPVKTIQTNILGSINVLEYAKQNNALVFQASTSEVYGDPSISPQTEDYWGNVNPIGIRSCYDEGKRAAETLFFDYLRQYSIKIKVCRIFNTYGPKMSINDGRVVSNFIVQALKNEPLQIYGNGENTRSFCYVDDLIEGMIRMMNTGEDITGPINLGSDNEIRVIDLARIILDITGSSSDIDFISPLSDDPQQRKPDINLAQRILNWKTKTELKSGLEKTINYFKGKSIF